MEELRLEHLRRLQLEPDDVIILRAPPILQAYNEDVLCEQLAAVFPGHKVLIMPGEVDISVIRNVSDNAERCTEAVPMRHD